MLITIEKIKELKQVKKKKWGKPLVDYLKPHFDNNERLDVIQALLIEQHQLEISLQNLQKLKSNYYNKPRKKTSKIFPDSGNSVIYTENKPTVEIVQKQEVLINKNYSAEDAYMKIYNKKKSNDFDLGDL